MVQKIVRGFVKRTQFKQQQQQQQINLKKLQRLRNNAARKIQRAQKIRTDKQTIENNLNRVFTSLEKDKSIAAKTSEEILKAMLIAMESEVIKATAQNANDLHIIISVLEISNS